MPAMLPISHVFQRRDARKINDETVRALMASVAELGFLNPLRVRAAQRHVDGRLTDAYEVIAGAHRLTAAMKLGLADVPCVVVDDDDLHAELAMIDENLCRAELSPAERAKQTARRKTIYEELHPETANGSNQHTRVGQLVQPSFADATAAAIGKDARTVRRDAERGEKISDGVLALVAGTDLDTGSYLDKLKKLGPREQEARVRRELAEKRKPISPAPAPRNEFESEQEWLTKVVKLFDRAPQEWRERARSHLYPDNPIMDARFGS